MASKFEGNQLSTALEKMVSGAKKSAGEQGIAIQNEKSFSINGVPFHAFTANIPNSVSIVSYMGLAGNVGYSFQGFSKVSDAGSDPEISNMVHSFKLLTPPTAVVASNHSDKTAFQFGTIVGKVAMGLFAVGLLGVIISRAKKKQSD